MMHGRSLVLGLLVGAIGAGSGAALGQAAPPAPVEADLVLTGGEIYTPAGWVQAMAVRRGVIIALGSDEAINVHKAASTQVLELNGAAVVPGLHDMHVHPLMSGLQAEYSCTFGQGSNAQQVLDAIKACVGKRAKGEWISGGQWDAASFGKTPPHRSMLDRVSPDNPVVLADISGHSAWVNSKALELAAITSATKDPAGGIIERDAKGVPTGLLRESAAGLVRRLIPAYTPEQNVKGLSWSLQLMLSHGITSFTDAGVDEGTMEAYATLADRGVLKQRARGCIMWRSLTFTAGSNGGSTAIERRNLYARDRFKPDCIKMGLDGVPTDGHTAAMVEPYEDGAYSDEARARGLLMVPPGPLKQAVTDFDRRGLTVKFHAAGDAAVRAGLDAIEAARSANGFSGLLHDVGHNSFVQMSDIARGRGIGATFEMSPYIWYPNPIIPDIAKAIGPERMKRWIPVKDAIDAGALVVPGSDWAVVPSVNPWIGLETLVTRQKLGGGGDALGGAEKIPLQQAFDMFTVNAARQMGNRNRTGSIEPGLLADVLVLDRNPFKIPVTDIHNVKVRVALINGEIVYRAQSDGVPSGTAAADIIFRNGEIYTPKGWVQALAVSNGVITALGDDAAVARSKGAATTLIDLKGATVLPGLHDMHVHPIGSGQLHTQCTFPQGSKPSVVLDTIKGCVTRHKKGEWITGGQWDAASFGKTPVHRSLLDKVAPDNPVALMDISVHALWLNSRALELAGITAKTPSPEGGVIERDTKGEPTGVLRESARGLVQRVTPPPSPEQTAEALKWALGEMLSYGITSYTDAGIGEDGLQAYATLADKGELKQRVRGCIAWRPSLGGSSAAMPDPIEKRNLYARDRFKPDCIKIVLDGVPTDGHTAAMVEPYADAAQTDAARAKGMLMVPPGPLKAALIDFDSRGLTVKMHAAGDAAVRAGLDAIEAARKANGFSGILHDVSHNSFVQMNDIKRARDLSATFEMSPYIWYPNPIIPDILKAVGPERMKRWTPVKDAIDAGALVVPGSDWAVVPSVNPWIAIETLVTRQPPGGDGEALGEVEKITLEQAINLFTVNGARQMGNRSRTGTLERGMLADMVVLDRNPFRIPITQVHETRVKMTVINGEVVFDAGK